MKSFLSEKALNVGLRASTIALKFLLSILVIKKLSIDDYGVFGLFQSSIIIMTFIIGFDFYSFSSREMLKDGAKEFNFYFKHQLLFHLFCYIIILPFVYFMFKTKVIEHQYITMFYLILIAEHISQELYRVLIILKKTVQATLVLFVRSGVWIFFLYSFWELNIIEANINSLLTLWLFGAVFSIFIAFKKIDFKWIKGIDFRWIQKGVKIALPFFIGTILYKLIEFSGRYFLSYYFSSKEVGIFTFFSGIANILFVFIQTIVIIELYPILLESKNKGEDKFLITLNTFKRQTFFFSLIGILLSALFIYPLLVFLGKAILFDNILCYIILLFSTTVFSYSFISHYALYTYKKDFEILKATAAGFVFNIVFSFLLIPRFGVLGAAIAQFASFFVIFFMKYIYWIKIKAEI